MTGITNPAEEYFKDGAWGWDGTAWRKLNLLFGYYDRYVEAVSAVAVGGGNADTQTTAVPAGYVYLIQCIAVKHNAAAAVEVTCGFFGEGIGVFLMQESLAPNVWKPFFTVGVSCKVGDYVRAWATAPGAGKTLYLRVWGNIMKVT